MVGGFASLLIPVVEITGEVDADGACKLPTTKGRGLSSG